MTGALPDWIETEFDQYVRLAVFGSARPSAHPVFVAIGGQPGAGKTAGQLHVRRLYPDRSITPIIGDDLRRFHRDYDRLMEQDPLRMPEATAPASAAWVEACLEHARVERFHTLVEGTFRRPEVTLGTVREFRAAGYRTHLVAVAVPPWESRLSTLERFVVDHAAGRAARWTPLAAHDAGVRGTRATLRAAAEVPELVDRVTVMNRAGSVLFDGPPVSGLRRTPQAAVLAEHRRRPTGAAVRDWTARLTACRAYLERNLPATEETRATLHALARNRQQLLAAVTDTGPAGPTTQLDGPRPGT